MQSNDNRILHAYSLLISDYKNDLYENFSPITAQTQQNHNDKLSTNSELKNGENMDVENTDDRYCLVCPDCVQQCCYLVFINIPFYSFNILYSLINTNL